VDLDANKSAPNGSRKRKAGKGQTIGPNRRVTGEQLELISGTGIDLAGQGQARHRAIIKATILWGKEDSTV